MTEIALRQLSKQECERVFAHPSGAVDLGPYIRAVQEMEGGVGYGIALNGISARSLKVRMGRAAKSLGLTLRWAKAPKDAAEVVVELGEPAERKVKR